MFLNKENENFEINSPLFFIPKRIDNLGSHANCKEKKNTLA